MTGFMDKHMKFLSKGKEPKREVEAKCSFEPTGSKAIAASFKGQTTQTGLSYCSNLVKSAEKNPGVYGYTVDEVKDLKAACIMEAGFIKPMDDRSLEA